MLLCSDGVLQSERSWHHGMHFIKSLFKIIAPNNACVGGAQGPMGPRALGRPRSQGPRGLGPRGPGCPGSQGPRAQGARVPSGRAPALTAWRACRNAGACGGNAGGNHCNQRGIASRQRSLGGGRRLFPSSAQLLTSRVEVSEKLRKFFFPYDVPAGQAHCWGGSSTVDQG